MPRTFRVAIIGSTGKGNYGHGIDTVWKAIPEAEIVALADDDAQGRAAGVARTGAKTGYADYREMLDRERPEVVAIGPRWVNRHFEMVMACAERGCHIFMEKPFCRTLAEADRLVRQCEMSHVKLAIAHQTRYSPTTAAVQKLIAAGTLGTLLELRARGKEDQRGGAEDLWVLGSHLMNLMQCFAGDAATCCATLASQGRPVVKADVVEGKEGLGPLAGDQVDARFDFAGGVVGYFASHRQQAGTPSRFALQLFGSKGVVEVLPGYLEPAWFLPDASWSPGRSGAKWVAVSSAGLGVAEPLKPGGLHAGNVAAVQDLLAAIGAQRQPLCDVYAARATIEMIMAVFESHRTGGPVSLPLENRQHPLAMLK